MAGTVLSEDDLEVAEASLEFALENCPVEGLLSTDDGTSITFDMIEAVLEKVKSVESQPASAHELDGVDLARLQSVMQYTSENCPVEGVARFHDGRQVSGRDLLDLAQKLSSPG